MRLNKKTKSLFNYKNYHKTLYENILEYKVRPKRRHFKAADMFIRTVGEERIKFAYPFFYIEIDMGTEVDKVKVNITPRDKSYYINCNYWLDRPAFISIDIRYKEEWIANINGSIYGIKKYFRRAFKNLKKKIEDGKKPNKNTGMFYYLVHQDHCSCYDDNKFYDI